MNETGNCEEESNTVQIQEESKRGNTLPKYDNLLIIKIKIILLVI